MKEYTAWFIRQLHVIRVNVAVRIVAGIVQVALGLLLVWLCRRFIDYAVWQDNVVEEVSLLVGALLASVGIRQATFYLQSSAEIVQQNAIRQRLFDQLLSRQLYSTTERLHSGDISQRLERDIATVSAITTDVLPRMVVTGVQLMGAFMLMLSMDAWLAWSLLLLTPFVALSAKYLAHRLRHMTLAIRKEESSIQMLVQESMENETAIKSVQGEGVVSRRIHDLHIELHHLVMRRTRFTVITRFLLASTFGLGYLGAFVYGGLQLKDGLITFGVMTAFLQLVSQIQSPVVSLLNMIPQIIHATASIDRIKEIENMEVEEAGMKAYGQKPQSAKAEAASEQSTKAEAASQQASKAEAASAQASKAEAASAKASRIGIRLDHVSYHYPDYPKIILQDFSHDFRPGTSTAIVGETGRGKTTLLRLLSGLAMPTSGSVSMYDTLGYIIPHADMRTHMTYIPQGNTMLSGTIRSNMLLARPSADEADIKRALHIAAADFVLDLPNGIDTEIGEHAVKLSEGQAQRLAIARGVLHGGSILLLDEISSSLDPATEKTLLTRLFEASPDKTIILVTHRMEAADQCDERLDMG